MPFYLLAIPYLAPTARCEEIIFFYDPCGFFLRESEGEVTMKNPTRVPVFFFDFPRGTIGGALTLNKSDRSIGGDAPF